MNDLRKFDEWYSSYLDEALTQVPYVPQNNTVWGKAQRLGMDLWNRWQGQGGIDWQDREQQAQAAQAQRAQQIASGNPADPAVIQRKTGVLATAFEQAMLSSLGKVSPKTRNAIKSLAQQMAPMFTTNRELLPHPVVQVLPLVHADPNVGDQVKKNQWETPTKVLRDVLMPSFEQTTDAWYNSQGRNYTEKVHPGQVFNPNNWTTATQNWKQSGQAKKTFNVNWIDQELQKARQRPGYLPADQISDIIDQMVRDVTNQGHQVQLNPGDKEALVKKWAKPETEESFLQFMATKYPLGTRIPMARLQQELQLFHSICQKQGVKADTQGPNGVDIFNQAIQQFVAKKRRRP